MALEAEATRLYALLPRDKRNDLYNAVIGNPLFPFHDGPDTSHAGRYFLIATGDYRAPVANDPLDNIINSIALNKGYTDDQKNDMYRVYIEEIDNITGGYKRRGRNVAAFTQTIGRVKTPRNHAVMPENAEAIVRSFLSGMNGNRGLGTSVNEERKRLQELASRPFGAPGAGKRKTRKSRKSRKSRKHRKF